MLQYKLFIVVSTRSNLHDLFPILNQCISKYIIAVSLIQDLGFLHKVPNSSYKVIQRFLIRCITKNIPYESSRPVITSCLYVLYSQLNHFLSLILARWLVCECIPFACTSVHWRFSDLCFICCLCSWICRF